MPYIIQSGKPAGEVYHRQVYVARNKRDAFECKLSMERAINQLGPVRWFDGPRIFEVDHVDGDARALHWDGHEEVMAPLYETPYPLIQF